MRRIVTIASATEHARSQKKVDEPARVGRRRKKSSRDFETRLDRKELLGLCDAAQRITADRNQPTAYVGAKRIGKARRQQNILLDRAAHRQDAADLVHRWTDDREI